MAIQHLDKSRAASMERKRAYLTLRDQGYSIRNALKAVGYSEASLSYVCTKIEAERKQGLMSTLAPIAKRAVRQIAQGKTVGNAVGPRAADVLHAAEIILDRIDPKVQYVDQQTTSITISDDRLTSLLTALDLSHLIDVAPQPVVSDSIPSSPVPEKT